MLKVRTSTIISTISSHINKSYKQQDGNIVCKVVQLQYRDSTGTEKVTSIGRGSSVRGQNGRLNYYKHTYHNFHCDGSTTNVSPVVFISTVVR